MKAYSVDLRERVLAAVDAKEGTWKEIAARFRRIERRRIRSQASMRENVHLWLCWKYSNQPRSVLFISAMLDK